MRVYGLAHLCQTWADMRVVVGGVEKFSEEEREVHDARDDWGKERREGGWRRAVLSKGCHVREGALVS